MSRPTCAGEPRRHPDRTLALRSAAAAGSRSGCGSGSRTAPEASRASAAAKSPARFLPDHDRHQVQIVNDRRRRDLRVAPAPWHPHRRTPRQQTPCLAAGGIAQCHRPQRHSPSPRGASTGRTIRLPIRPGPRAGTRTTDRPAPPAPPDRRDAGKARSMPAMVDRFLAGPRQYIRCRHRVPPRPSMHGAASGGVSTPVAVKSASAGKSRLFFPTIRLADPVHDMPRRARPERREAPDPSRAEQRAFRAHHQRRSAIPWRARAGRLQCKR